MPKKINLEKFAEDVHNLPAVEIREKYNLGDRPVLRYIKKAHKSGLMDKEEIYKFVLDETRFDFPSEIEPRMEAMLSSVNTAPKRLTMLTLDDIPKTCTDIRNYLLSIGINELPDPSSFNGYCEETLLPIGMIAKLMIGTVKGVKCWETNDANDNYGKPIAAFTLIYGIENEIPIVQFLGRIQSAWDSRSPYNRARIIEILQENPNRFMSSAELSNKFDIISRPSISRHLQSLKKLGIIDYESISLETHICSLYTWLGRNDLEIPPSRSKIRNDVIDWFKKNGIGKYNEIAKDLEANPTTITHILSDLEERGFLGVKYKESSTQSKARINKNGIKYYNFLKKFRNAISDGSELEMMKELQKELEADDELFRLYANKSMELYSPFSNSNTRTSEEAIKEALGFIETYYEEYGIGPRSKEIRNNCGGTCFKHFPTLLENNKVYKEKKGMEVRWYLK